MKSSNSRPLQTRMKRIMGQVAGIKNMMDEERYCVDILNQISAVRSALDALGVELLTHHIEHCVAGEKSSAHAKAKPMSREQLLAELRTALSRFLN